MASEFNWPRPWLIGLYEQAIAEGCIRIVLRSETAEEREVEWKSFRASFLRIRRRKDADPIIASSPEFALVSLRFERETGKVLLIYSALPDGEQLPVIESVSGKRDMPVSQPVVRQPSEESPEDFDPTAHVRGLIDSIELPDDDDEEGASEF